MLAALVPEPSVPQGIFGCKGHSCSACSVLLQNNCPDTYPALAREMLEKCLA